MRLKVPFVPIVNINLNKLTLGFALRICLVYLIEPNKYTRELGVNCIGVRLEALRQDTMNGSKGKHNPTLKESKLT